MENKKLNQSGQVERLQWMLKHFRRHKVYVKRGDRLTDMDIVEMMQFESIRNLLLKPHAKSKGEAEDPELLKYLEELRNSPEFRAHMDKNGTEIID